MSAKGKRLVEHKDNGYLWNIKAKAQGGCGYGDTFACGAIPPFPKSGLPLRHGQVSMIGWLSRYVNGSYQLFLSLEIDNSFAVFDIPQ